MIQNIFIIGATGNVGSTLVKQIFEKQDSNRTLHQNPTRILGIASSKNYLFSENGLSKDDCFNFIERKEKFEEYNSLDKLIEIAEESRENLVFVDVTASKGMTDFHLKIVESENFGIVTANKNPLALNDYKIFRKLTNNVGKYGYRCSVMAGAEAVSLLQDLKDVNDAPILLSGCFSGTLGYVCTELEKRRKFSEITREAKEKGYTEPHPRDDLNGLDVARKLLILARTAGYKANIEDVLVSPFIPKEYLAEDNVNTFLDSAKGLDDYFAKTVEKSAEEGNVLRYVAKMNVFEGVPILNVSIEEVPKESPLGMLSGTSNKIMLVSKTYSIEKPYIVEAPGAGLEITAQNIRRDLLHQLNGRRLFKSF